MRRLEVREQMLAVQGPLRLGDAGTRADRHVDGRRHDGVAHNRAATRWLGDADQHGVEPARRGRRLAGGGGAFRAAAQGQVQAGGDDTATTADAAFERPTVTRRDIPDMGSLLIRTVGVEPAKPRAAGRALPRSGSSSEVGEEVLRPGAVAPVWRGTARCGATSLEGHPERQQHHRRTDDQERAPGVQPPVVAVAGLDCCPSARPRRRQPRAGPPAR